MTLTDEQTAEAGERPRAQSLPARLSRRFPRAGTMLILGVLILILNGLHVHAYTVISPFDENFHIDTMIRSSRFEFVQPDDTTTQESLDEVACRGTDDIAPWPPCKKEGRYKPEEFSYKGWNGASSEPPYYYFVSGVTARILRAPDGKSIVTWGRVLGSLWLLVGVYFVVRAAEYFAIRRLPLLLSVMLLVASPSLLHATNTINANGSGFVCGAVVLLAGLSWERRRASLWVLGAAAVFCASFDSANALGVVLVLFYFLGRAVASHRQTLSEAVRSWREYLVAGLVAAAGAAIAILSWRIVHQLLSHDVDFSHYPSVVAHRVNHLDLKMLFGRQTLFSVFPPVFGYVPPILNTTAHSLFTQAALILVGGLLIAAAVRTTLADRVSALAAATVAALILTPVMFVIYNYVGSSQYFPIGPRNALTALPAVAIAVAAGARNRFGIALLGIVAVGLYLSTAVALL
jgi:hypothetical protein